MPVTSTKFSSTKFLVVVFLSIQAGLVKAQTQVESICFGTTAKGKLKHGVKIPNSGANFESYSNLMSIAGRTYVHSKVKTIVVNAYRSLQLDLPDKVFKFAETGFKDGGVFKPHKTHRNGLSVDFMVPVVDKSGISVHLPTNIFNKFGYAIEFDNQGHYKGFTIDFEAMAAHIVQLDREAKRLGLGLWRVIFDPKLQHYLFQTKESDYLKKYVRFSQRQSWVRHDEHYHIDFEVPCNAF